jgi:hypothetical protein
MSARERALRPIIPQRMRFASTALPGVNHADHNHTAATQISSVRQPGGRAITSSRAASTGRHPPARRAPAKPTRASPDRLSSASAAISAMAGRATGARSTLTWSASHRRSALALRIAAVDPQQVPGRHVRRAVMWASASRSRPPSTARSRGQRRYRGERINSGAWYTRSRRPSFGVNQRRGHWRLPLRVHRKDRSASAVPLRCAVLI